jgi:tripartite-type tricarboxylate transporter receptor subunit TctC
MRACTAAAAFLALQGAMAGATAQTVADFYKGKAITLSVGVDVGGGYDAYARLMARYLEKYIPGNPRVSVQNMPSAGGITQLNYMANLAPRDGTAIGATQQYIPFEPLLSGKDSKAQFDPLKFLWLGSPAPFSAVAVAWHTAPVKRAEDLLTHELVVGASGATSGIATDAYVARNILGFKFKVVLGYKGGADLNLAMERGETQGRPTSGWQGIKTAYRHALEEKKIILLYQIGLEKHPGIPADVPLILDFAKTPEDRQVLELKFASYSLGYPYMLPAGTPADRVAALRTAFKAALADPGLLADAEKQGMEIQPVAPETIEAILKRAYAAPPELLARLAEASKPPADARP